MNSITRRTIVSSLASTRRTHRTPYVPISVVGLHASGGGFPAFTSVHFADAGSVASYFGDDPPSSVVRDDELYDYETRICAPTFLVKMSSTYRSKVATLFDDRCGGVGAPVVVARDSFGEVDSARKDRSDPSHGGVTADSVALTIKLMQAKTPIIHRPALQSKKFRLWGVPDLIVHSSALPKIVDSPPSSTSSSNAYHPIIIRSGNVSVGAHNVVTSWGSRADDIVKGSLYSLAIAEMLSSDADAPPPHAFVAGKKLKKSSKGSSPPPPSRPDSELGEIHPPSPADLSAALAALSSHTHTTSNADNDDYVEKSAALASKIATSLSWCRSLYDLPNSREWRFDPSDPNLWPLLVPAQGNSKDKTYPWANFKNKLLKGHDDISFITNVGGKQRNHANNVHNIYKRSTLVERVVGPNSDLTVSEALGMKSKTSQKAKQINNILTVNDPAFHDISTEKNVARFLPDKLLGRNNKCTFYVDFETVTSIHDDFETFPHGEPATDLIFMIWCRCCLQQRVGKVRLPRCRPSKPRQRIRFDPAVDGNHARDSRVLRGGRFRFLRHQHDCPLQYRGEDFPKFREEAT